MRARVYGACVLSMASMASRADLALLFFGLDQSCRGKRVSFVG